MDLIVTGVLAGVLGTLMMDFLNHLFARIGMISKIDVRMIGRMALGWARGRFCYCHPSEMKPVANEKLIGYITHYSIGVALAIPFVVGWAYFFGGPVSPVWTLTYGVATTVASVLFVYPSMGFGFFACGLSNALGLRFPVWPITCSSEWVWQSRLPLRDRLGR